MCLRKSKWESSRLVRDPLGVQAISEASQTPRTRWHQARTPWGCQRSPGIGSAVTPAGVRRNGVGRLSRRLPFVATPRYSLRPARGSPGPRLSGCQRLPPGRPGLPRALHGRRMDLKGAPALLKRLFSPLNGSPALLNGLSAVRYAFHFLRQTFHICGQRLQRCGRAFQMYRKRRQLCGTRCQM